MSLENQLTTTSILQLTEDIEDMFVVYKYKHDDANYLAYETIKISKRYNMDPLVIDMLFKLENYK